MGEKSKLEKLYDRLQLFEAIYEAEKATLLDLILETAKVDANTKRLARIIEQTDNEIAKLFVNLR